MTTTTATIRASLTSQAGGTPLVDLGAATALDATDPLREHRAKFHFPTHQGNEKQRYFAGNSLGLQHVDVPEAVQGALAKWQSEGVEGWWTGWFELDDGWMRQAMADLVGAAAATEVVLMNTLTVNLHFMFAVFYQPSGKKTKILCEQYPFPSDMHAFVSQARHHGLSADDVLTVGENDAPAPISTQSFIDAIDAHHDEIALVVISAVHFLSGQFFDIPAIVAAAKRHGLLVGVDAAHGVGNVPLRLHEWDVDFAVWCTYKYLNGGPGNVGGAFVHQKHFQQQEGDSSSSPLQQRLHGWWGNARQSRFQLTKQFTPSDGAAAFQISTVNVVGMTMLGPSLRLAASIGMDALRAKSLQLTGYLEYLVETELSHALTLITPKDPMQRGSQLSVRIRSMDVLASLVIGREVYECGTGEDSPATVAQKQLLNRGIVVDNRPPDVLRLSPTATYNSFEDVWVLCAALKEIMKPE